MNRLRNSQKSIHISIIPTFPLLAGFMNQLYWICSSPTDNPYPLYYAYKPITANIGLLQAHMTILNTPWIREKAWKSIDPKDNNSTEERLRSQKNLEIKKEGEEWKTKRNDYWVQLPDSCS